MRSFRSGLLASVSVAALALTQPYAARAADLGGKPAKYEDAPAARHWSWWVEGGALRLEGDPGIAGMGNPPFDVLPQRWGWEAAIGADFNNGISPWIWSAQFRIARHGEDSASNNPIATFQGNGTTPVIAGINSADRDEHRWLADFMVGRDLGVGSGPKVLKFGVRVAEIRGKTKGSAFWDNIPISNIASCAGTPSYCGSELRQYNQENRFLGVGPRLELDGTVPLNGAWSIQYMGGAAALFGRRKVGQTVLVTNPTVPTFTGPATLIAGGPINTSSSDNDVVFNLDALLGISYAVSSTSSITLSYRFDGYWNGLLGFNANANLDDLDRFYHGPMVRFTKRN